MPGPHDRHQHQQRQPGQLHPRVRRAGGAAVQPGTIHADSDGSACGSNETIFQGKRLDGIVAYAAPDFSEHGIISSFAKRLGVANAIISDGFDRIYGSDGLNFASSMSAPKYPVSPLGLITRKIVDDRYLAGLRAKVQAAESLFNLLSSTSAATAQGFSILNACTGANQDEINALSGDRRSSTAPVQGRGDVHQGRGGLLQGHDRAAGLDLDAEGH